MEGQFSMQEHKIGEDNWVIDVNGFDLRGVKVSWSAVKHLGAGH